MIPMIGHDVSYRRGAFVVEGDRKLDLGGIAHYRLDDAVEYATKSILEKSDGRWMILKKRLGLQNDDIAAELMVIVPAGPDQREQLLAAVNLFDEFVAKRLGEPVDVAFRDIEPPTCIGCGQTATHVRVKFREDGQLEERKYFCDIHARDQSEFDYSKTNRYSKANRSSLSWEQLDPANI